MNFRFPHHSHPNNTVFDNAYKIRLADFQFFFSKMKVETKLSFILGKFKKFKTAYLVFPKFLRGIRQNRPRIP